MNQPDLGKKIAELRKAKGFTQEELVEKCNLSVRTLQRIESGEVTPRSYTLRLIFTNLEYSYDDSFEKNKNGFFLFHWLEQLYRYVFDLFNLKTKTMKKISILTIMLSSLFLIATAINNSQDPNLAKSDINETNLEQPDQKDLVFSNFYCENCFEDNNDLIGHGVSFKTNGVTIKMDLIKLNKVSREFNCGMIQGKLLENKVEVMCPKELTNDESVTLLAEDINKLEDKIVLKGNASLKSADGDLIEADEIVIIYK